MSEIEAFDIVLDTSIDRNDLIKTLDSSEDIQEQYHNRRNIYIYDTEIRQEYYLKMIKHNWLVIVGENIKTSNIVQTISDEYGIQNYFEIETPNKIIK